MLNTGLNLSSHRLSTISYETGWIAFHLYDQFNLLFSSVSFTPQRTEGYHLSFITQELLISIHSTKYRNTLYLKPCSMHGFRNGNIVCFFIVQVLVTTKNRGNICWANHCSTCSCRLMVQASRLLASACSCSMSWCILGPLRIKLTANVLDSALTRRGGPSALPNWSKECRPSISNLWLFWLAVQNIQGAVFLCVVSMEETLLSRDSQCGTMLRGIIRP